MKKISYFVLFVVTILLGGLIWVLWPGTIPQQPACTDDAKICPDGSSVARTGPNCEFAPCPQGGKTNITEEPTFKGQVLAGESAPLLVFNQEDYEAALKTEKLIILYFYANWCPICAEETANALYPAFNQLKTDQAVGFRVNFRDSDTERPEEDLAREFGISYQHSKVFIKNGKRVLKAPESWDLEDYLSQIAKLL